MKLMIRAHDLGVKGEDNIVNKLDEWGLDGIQLVAYKSINGVTLHLCRGCEKDPSGQRHLHRNDGGYPRPSEAAGL